MYRRAVLGLLAATCGCSTRPAGEEQNSTPTATAEPTATETDLPTATQNTAVPTPQPQAGAGCLPALDEDTTVYCGDDHGAPRTTADPESFDNPRGEAEFIFSNDGDSTLQVTPDGYQLYARGAEQWKLVIPKSGAGGGSIPRDLPPGESRSWTVRTNTTDLGPVHPPDSEDGGPSTSALPHGTSVFRLPPGEYAFGFDASTAESDDRYRYAARFSVGGDEVALVPTDRLASHGRDGGTLTVRTATTAEYDHDREVTLLCERVTEAESIAHLSRFELYNPGYDQIASYERPFVEPTHTALLRDGLAIVGPDDERIRIETMDTTKPPLGLSDDDSVAVAAEGSVWRLRAENGWS